MRAAGLLVALVVIAGPAAAQEPARAGSDEPRAEAERTFEEGNRNFHGGNYREAIPLFQRAYDLSGEPALVFNIAQAHRLAGDCQQAIAAYRRFLSLAGDPSLREAAQGHIVRLGATCPVTPPPVIITTPSKPAPPPPSDSPWRIVGLTGMAGGVATLATAGGLYLWNGTRYQRWEDEDQRLRGREVPVNEAVDRQATNDELWRSIQRSDRTSVGVAIAGAALTLAGAIVWWNFRSSDSVSVAFGGTAVRGQVRW